MEAPSSDTLPEYKAYLELRPWQPLHTISPAAQFMPYSSTLYPLFTFLYQLLEDFCQRLPKRKNQEVTFTHPMNVVHFLQQATINGQSVDDLALITGLLHDYVEDSVDLCQQQQSLKHSSPHTPEQCENAVILELREKMQRYCHKNGLSLLPVGEILATIKLLTRHKQDSYYVYISTIFNTPDQQRKVRAIQVKLADRIHNVLCITCFNERERIFQCFKNLFILNNVKKHLLDTYGPTMFTGKINNVTENLFNKCIKATYDAFLQLCHTSTSKETFPVHSLLQLAFYKYTLLYTGLNSVTEQQEQDPHLARLYQGIIRKYDALLHRELQRFENSTQKELAYCQNFFADYHFTPQQLQHLVDYKDAYALKEVLAHLLYQPQYFMSLFVSSELSDKGRIPRTAAKRQKP